jgi:chorismate synthase
MSDDLRVSQGEFRAARRLDGAVVITCPPLMVVDPLTALAIAQAILREAGVKVTELDQRKLA